MNTLRNIMLLVQAACIGILCHKIYSADPELVIPPSIDLLSYSVVYEPKIYGYQMKVYRMTDPPDLLVTQNVVRGDEGRMVEADELLDKVYGPRQRVSVSFGAGPDVPGISFGSRGPVKACMEFKGEKRYTSCSCRIEPQEVRL